MIRQILLENVPCLFYEGIFFAGSIFVTMHVADSSTREYHRMSTRVSRSMSGSEVSSYFGIDTHRYTLVLQSTLGYCSKPH